MREQAPQGRLVAALGAMIVSACVSGNWTKERTLSPADLPAARTLSPAPIDAAAWPTDTWWQAYGDPQLDALIKQALAGSPSLTIAEARLHAAQAQVTGAQAARLPFTSLDAAVERQRYPEHGLYPPPFAGGTFTDGRIALDLSYDIDFWGRQRALFQSAQAAARAAEADKAAARLALSVALTNAYIQLDLWYNLRDVAQSNLEQQSAIADLTQRRVSAGLENTARVKQSESLLALTRASLDATQASIDLAQNQIAALVGAGPDRALSLTRPQLKAPERLTLPAALPVDLLGRRPDLVAARWRVEAAARGVAASEAAFYPNVNLTAFAGVQSIGLDNLLQASAHILGVSPALSLPIFNRGELRGALQAQQAQYDLAVGEYNQTLVDSVHQVADVVANWQALEKETAEQQIALEAAQRSYDLTRQRYGAGLDNYLTVLSSENQVLEAQALRAVLIARRLTFKTDLIRALGGGYSG
jgi:NodT family efflux transporter outer membrane factor (OMF) lipoprotein